MLGGGTLTPADTARRHSTQMQHAKGRFARTAGENPALHVEVDFFVCSPRLSIVPNEDVWRVSKRGRCVPFSNDNQQVRAPVVRKSASGKFQHLACNVGVP